MLGGDGCGNGDDGYVCGDGGDACGDYCSGDVCGDEGSGDGDVCGDCCCPGVRSRAEIDGEVEETVTR